MGQAAESEQVAISGRKLRRRGSVVALTAAFVATPSVVAFADPWGDTLMVNLIGTGPHPDGGDVWYCYGASNPAHLENNIDIAMDAIDESDATVRFHNCTGNTDIQFEEDDLGVPGRYGVSTCAAWWAPAFERCNRNIATLDVDEIRDAVDPQADISRGFAYNWVACHEAGHGVGLTHYGTNPTTAQESQPDCMRSNLININNPTADVYQKYSAHHKNHLNAFF